MERVEHIFESIYARANEIRDSDDPERLLRELLKPVEELYTSAERAEFDMHKNFDTTTQSFIETENMARKIPCTDAAARIQALVRGSKERQVSLRQKNFLEQGTKVLRKYVLKQDRFPNCHVLGTPFGDIAPNFRRLDATPFYGTAQPTMDGIKLILKRVADDGFRNVVWINLREEAVIYVSGDPYTARRSAKLNENDLVPGITGHTVQVLELAMKRSLQEQLVKGEGHFECWHEVGMYQNELVAIDTVMESQVQTLPEIYKLDEVITADPRLLSVQYYRIPIERENAPEHSDVEKIMQLIHSSNDTTEGTRTAFVFNCQMGKRRTTTAMVLGTLIWQGMQLTAEDISSRMNSENTFDSHPCNGNFNAIRELVAKLIYGVEAKWWVDTTIDQCAATCNLRSVIHEYHEMSTAEPKPAKRSYYLHHALSFLERYFYMIVFGAYILSHTTPSQAEPNTEEQEYLRTGSTSFSKWLQGRPNLFRLLDDLGGVKYKSDKVLEKCVLKLDHFPGIVRIPHRLTAQVPNFRQIANEPIFGTAQCLEDGIRDVVRYLQPNYNHAIWINLREEAVIYVRGRPFVLRQEDTILENVEFPGIEVDEITAIEAQLKEELQMRVRKANGFLLFWHEIRELVSEETIEHVNPDSEINTLREIYQEVAMESDFDLKYARIPVSDETAPEEKDLDDLVRLVMPSFLRELNSSDEKDITSGKDRRTAVICNCQMGRGRTTAAIVCVYMIRLVLEDHYRVTTTISRLLERAAEGSNESKDQDKQSTRANGYVIINKLVQTLDNGEQSLRLVDYCVNECDQMQNLRDCISQCYEMAMDRELSFGKHDFYMRRAVNYLERYFYLICFASYLLEERVHNFQRMLFVTWMNTRYHSAIYALLDNLGFGEDDLSETHDTESHVSSMRWRWRRKRKLVSRLE